MNVKNPPSPAPVKHNRAYMASISKFGCKDNQNKVGGVGAVGRK